MPRRVNIPGADELFRATAPVRTPDPEPEPTPAAAPASGRVKHDEKMTVYVTAEELLAVEPARLTLRSELGRKVDRGRLVRAALAVALDDLRTRGINSDVARVLGEQ